MTRYFIVHHFLQIITRKLHFLALDTARWKLKTRMMLMEVLQSIQKSKELIVKQLQNFLSILINKKFIPVKKKFTQFLTTLEILEYGALIKKLLRIQKFILSPKKNSSEMI